jgi:outer membrane lipoprotein-sorting protein
MKTSSKRAAARALLAAALLAQATLPFAQSGPDGPTVIRSIDAAVQRRFDHVLGFTDVEHYQVFRGKDETHPVAEMTVKVTYKRNVGKSYDILSKSGSEIVQHFGLQPLLDNEKTVNLPGNVEHSWFNSSNYEMKLNPGGILQLDGRDCYALDVTAKSKASNTINGEIWVDAHDGNIVKLDGVASKSPSTFAGATHMMRQYNEIQGYPMASHARAESSSSLFGRTVVMIDYGEYQLQLASAR